MVKIIQEICLPLAPILKLINVSLKIFSNWSEIKLSRNKEI